MCRLSRQRSFVQILISGDKYLTNNRYKFQSSSSLSLRTAMKKKKLRSFKTNYGFSYFSWFLHNRSPRSWLRNQKLRNCMYSNQYIEVEGIKRIRKTLQIRYIRMRTRRHHHKLNWKSSIRRAFAEKWNKACFPALSIIKTTVLLKKKLHARRIQKLENVFKVA